MAYNGSGSYSLPAGNPVVTGTNITTVWANGTLSDIQTALSLAMCKDGQSTPTANLKMGGYKFTGLGVGSARTDSLNIAQLQDGALIWLGTGGGTVDVITAATSPVITAYAAGQVFRFIASGANTGAVTLDISGVGAKAITKNGAVALAAGDIPAAAVCTVVYDGTQFQLIGAVGGADINLGAGKSVVFEGATDNAFETTLSAADPTADRTQVLPDKSGTVAMTTDIVSEAYIYIRDEKASGTGGGTAATAWTKRDLNTEVNDAGGHASLASSVITLAAGTYRFRASVPGVNVNQHKVRLANTDDTIYYYGTSAYSPSTSIENRSTVSGRFTIAGSKAFELQHYCGAASAGGFGIASGLGVIEVYSEIEFWKEL